MARHRRIFAIIGVLALTGCESDNLPPPGTFERMPVTIDYRAHKTLNPPAPLPTGDVGPHDDKLGRRRTFGPESRATVPFDRGSLLASLAALRGQAPAGGSTLLALAKRKKPNRQARTDVFSEDTGNSTQESDNSGLTVEPHSERDQSGGYKLNFEDAEIKDVMQAVLGNVLGLNYTIAPNVSGRITISSAAPQSRAELLSTIETVLTLQGLSLTKDGNLYRIAPTAMGGGVLDHNGSQPGFGISVVPIEYSTVASIAKTLSGFIVDADGIRIDQARNAIIVRGPGPRRDEIVRAIKALDGDWMQRQSVSVFELRRSRPEDVIGELTRIFDADSNGEPSTVIQFKPIKRLRSIMVISKNPSLIKRASKWIQRLDHQSAASTDSVFVYRPRYRDARELTRLVNGLFGGQGGGVAYQQSNDSNDKDRSGQGSSGQSGMIGMSSASYAGGLSSGSSGGGVSGSAPGLGSSSGFGSGSGTGGPGSASSSGQSGNPSATSSNGGNGQQGSLADPIEAGQNPGNGRGRLALSADTSNNTIVAYTDGETYAKVNSVLKQLDVPPLQVAISVVVAEVQLNDELKYGVQFYLNNNKGSIGLGQVLSSAAGTAATAIAPQAAGLNFLVGSTSPSVVLNALDTISKIHILSTPSIVVMENKPATLEVGNQVPVITQTAQSNLVSGAPTVNSVTYVDTGIILKIIPRIGQNGTVAMDVDQVISGVVPDAGGSVSNSLTPTISKRRIASAIAVKSGQSVLLAGLINDTRQQSNGRVPFSGPIGDLLGNKDNSFNRTELVVFIRPVIVRDGGDAQEVADEFKTRLGAMRLQAPPVYKP